MRITDRLVLFQEMLGHTEVVFSVVSLASKQRKTFRVSRAPERKGLLGARERRGRNKDLIWFVSQLTGPDNNLSYTYLLCISAKGNDDVPVLKLTKKSPIAGYDHEAVAAFQWLFKNATMEIDQLQQCILLKACNCARCGRLLTVPESIVLGVGPNCQSLWRG